MVLRELRRDADACETAGFSATMDLCVWCGTAFSGVKDASGTVVMEGRSLQVREEASLVRFSGMARVS